MTRAISIVEALEDARFKLVNLPDVKGAPEAINALVAMATTPWIAHLDADDKWHPMKASLPDEEPGGGWGGHYWNLLPLFWRVGQWPQYPGWLRTGGRFPPDESNDSQFHLNSA
jgi:glycosyltransferase involved in cell wall biosynthesis